MPRTVVLVGKAPCPLCDEAAEVLGALQVPWGFTLERMSASDTRAEPEWATQVPVVLVEGRVICRLIGDRWGIERALRDAGIGPSG